MKLRSSGCSWTRRISVWCFSRRCWFQFETCVPMNTPTMTITSSMATAVQFWVRRAFPTWRRIIGMSLTRGKGVEESRDLGEVYRLVEEGLADPACEQERQGAGVHLLVVKHVLDQRRAARGDPRRREAIGEADRAEVGGYPLGVLHGAQPLPRRECERQRHARRDAFAV